MKPKKVTQAVVDAFTPQEREARAVIVKLGIAESRAGKAHDKAQGALFNAVRDYVIAGLSLDALLRDLPATVSGNTVKGIKWTLSNAAKYGVTLRDEKGVGRSKGDLGKLIAENPQYKADHAKGGKPQQGNGRDAATDAAADIADMSGAPTDLVSQIKALCEGTAEQRKPFRDLARLLAKACANDVAREKLAAENAARNALQRDRAATAKAAADSKVHAQAAAVGKAAHQPLAKAA